MKQNKIIIHQSSCSEQCFRLSGSLEKIKTEVLKMLDSWEKDEDFASNRTQKKAELKRLRKRIRNITDLKEFEIIKFDFTTNYETYFKEEKGDILVATCNNDNWKDIDCEFMDDDEYWSIRDGGRYLIAFEDDEYVLAQKKDDNDDVDKITDKILIKKDELTFDIEEEYNGEKTFRMFEKKGEHFIRNDDLNKIIKVKEVKDKQIIKQIETLIGLGHNGKEKL